MSAETGTRALSVAKLKAAALGDDEDQAHAAVLELHERAEAGDTASRKAIVEIGKDEAAQQIESVPAITLPGIAEALVDELGRIVLEAWPPASVEDAQGFAALAGAFRDVDAVLARIRAEQPSGEGLGPDVEAVLAQLWTAINEIPERDLQALDNRAQLADILVGRLRLRLEGK